MDLKRWFGYFVRYNKNTKDGEGWMNLDELKALVGE